MKRRPAPKFYVIRNEAGQYLTLNGDFKPSALLLSAECWTRFRDNGNNFSDNTATTFMAYLAQRNVKTTREVVK